MRWHHEIYLKLNKSFRRSHLDASRTSQSGSPHSHPPGATSPQGEPSSSPCGARQARPRAVCSPLPGPPQPHPCLSPIADPMCSHSGWKACGQADPALPPPPPPFPPLSSILVMHFGDVPLFSTVPRPWSRATCRSGVPQRQAVPKRSLQDQRRVRTKRVWGQMDHLLHLRAHSRAYRHSPALISPQPRHLLSALARHFRPRRPGDMNPAARMLSQTSGKGKAPSGGVVSG